jgi:hypothetical protein
MLCGLLASALMGVLVLSCAACWGGASAQVQQRKVLTMGPVPLLPPSESMCFDRLEAAIVKRNEMAYSMVQCVEAVRILSTALRSCSDSVPLELHVMPLPESAPHAADATFIY